MNKQGHARRRADGDTPAAYRHCAAVTRRRARNFHYGIQLLPPVRRRAMCAVYAFARRVDDIGDGDLPIQRKAEALERARADLAAVAEGHPPPGDPVLIALADAAARRPIPLGAFADLIDGVAMDVAGASYPTIDDLVVYCRRVAGSIGRLCVGVFGVDDPDAHRLADDLGVAMQLTNILRDVAEDLRTGRVYLPAADLDRFGVDLHGGRLDDFPAVVRLEAERARGWFHRGLPLVAFLDRRSTACVTAMTGIYRRLLRRIDADPAAVLSHRLSLPRWEKSLVAVSALLGAAAPARHPRVPPATASDLHQGAAG